MYIGPNIVSDGLVMCLDMGSSKSYTVGSSTINDLVKIIEPDGYSNIYDNTILSIKGDVTTNLLYSSGTFNGILSNLTGAFTVETIIENNRYRVTCNTTGSMRLLIPDGILINGETYTTSFKYVITTGPNLFIDLNDFCDNSFISRNSFNLGSYYFNFIVGNRATYDSKYRFTDFTNIQAGTVFEIWDIQVEQKTYPTEFTSSTRSVAISDQSIGSYTAVYDSDGKGSISFDGIGDRVDAFIPSNSALLVGGPIINKSIEVVFKTGSDINKLQLIYAQGAGVRGINFYILNGSVYVGGYNNTTSDYGVAWRGNWISHNLQINTWYSLTFVIRNASTTIQTDILELYINGNLIGKESGAQIYSHFSNPAFGGGVSVGASTRILGQSILHYNLPFKGKISQYKHYTIALSQSQITRNFNSIRKRYNI